MLNDLDETIKTILRDRGRLSPEEIDIAFDAPDREWASRVGKPTVNCYLYDIRENLTLRETDWIVERRDDGRIATKRQPPRRFNMSYVVTAWTAEVEDEHRLLWRVLSVLVRCPELPRDLLQGELARVEYPIRTEVAQPDGLLREPAEVWSALDNRIRPSVNLVATLPLEIMEPTRSPVIFTKRLRVRQPGVLPEELVQIAGVVRGTDGAPQPQALVRIRDHGYSTVAGPAGRFWLAAVPTGTYNLVAELDGQQGERPITVPGDDYDITLRNGHSHSQHGTSAQEGGRDSGARRRRRPADD